MPSALERGARALVRGVSRVPWIVPIMVHPVVARPGYWFATACGAVWGAAMSLGRVRPSGGVIVARHCPRWSFGGGGTTIGAVYLTHSQTRAEVLEHEAAHRAQWRRYGLAFIPLYIAAGFDALHNRFEIEADLVKGGYVRRPR